LNVLAEVKGGTMLRTLLFLWITLASCVCAVDGAVEHQFIQAKAASAGSGQDVSGWERYKAKGEEFSAQFPEAPSTYTVLRPSSVNAEGKVSEGRGFSSYGNDAVFVVMSFDNVKAKEPLQTFIDEFDSYGVRRSKLIFSSDVVLDHFAGRQFLLQSENAQGIVQFYLTDKHAYVFAAIAHDEKDSSIQRFLKSLAFNDKNKSSDIYVGNRAVTSAATSLAASSVGSANQNSNLPVAFNPQDVTTPAVIVTMPQPPYTDEARQQFITGTVILRGVLSSTGRVTNLRSVKGLPFGLTEQAIVAAQALKFFPAIKDGRRVSQHVQMEYNFDLY
jgi:TonB family protein